MVSVRHPIAPAQWGNANRRGQWARRTNSGMRMGARPLNQTRRIHRIGKLLRELPPRTHIRQYGVGEESEIRPPLGRAQNRLRMEDRYRTARPPHRIPKKENAGGCGGDGPPMVREFNDFQSRIFNLFLNAR